MNLVSKYIREQKRYTKNDLKKIFEFDEDGIEVFIKNLKAYGVLKCVANSDTQMEMTDLLDEDVEIADVSAESGDCLYVFTYVGIITLGSRIIKVYPKYLLSDIDDRTSEMKQVLRVLEKYSHSEEQIINLYNGDDEKRSFNILAVILFILRDFYEYGIYTNSEDIVEVNGNGEILWGKTIDEQFALIEDESPYYIEMYTEKTIDDDMDYYKRLHEWVLTDCSHMLHEAELDTLFDMDELSLSDVPFSDFGDREYVLERLHKEMNVQYNTRKQILLKTLYAYISQNRRLLDEQDGISMFGTTTFYSVWEKVCSEVLDNKLRVTLEQLTLPKSLSTSFDPKRTLIELIEKPKWICLDGTPKEARETLIPDLVSVTQIEGNSCFLIFDAKYYNIQLEKGKPLRGNPGVSDITKQYLYQLAYRDFIESQGFDIVRNCFLMPTEKGEILDKGIAKMEILEALGLQNIMIRQIPASMVYDLYLTRHKIDFSLLSLKK